MTEDWDELMSAPGGENHGRKRTPSGEWVRLDYNQAAAFEEHFDYIVEVPIHGTRDCYVNEACRCAACRRANTAYERKRRRGIHE